MLLSFKVTLVSIEGSAFSFEMTLGSVTDRILSDEVARWAYPRRFIQINEVSAK